MYVIDAVSIVSGLLLLVCVSGNLQYSGSVLCCGVLYQKVEVVSQYLRLLKIDKLKKNGGIRSNVKKRFAICYSDPENTYGYFDH